MRLNHIVSFLAVLGLLTIFAFYSYVFITAGLQQTFGPIPVDGETRDPSAWNRGFGIITIAFGSLPGLAALKVVRWWLNSTKNPDHRIDPRRP